MNLFMEFLRRTFCFLFLACTTATPLSAPSAITATTSTSIISPSKTVLAPPLTNAVARITKKTFGLFVDPTHSPISPERFRGYHTGDDLETTSDETKSDTPVSAACEGKLLVKKWASGYGGIAVESCILDETSVTVIYGHLRLSSIKPAIGSTLKQGETFALLGTGYSTETDGERKHLHFAIHRGTTINILGYVQDKTSLTQWMDPLPLLK